MNDPPGTTGLKGTSGIELLGFRSGNSYKPPILLEELRQIGALDYTVQFIDVDNGNAKQSWYLEINPNGKVPAIVDHNNGSFPVHETGAIYLYLLRHYDTSHTFSFTDPKEISQFEQWLAWGIGELSPWQAASLQFTRFHPLIFKIVDHFGIYKYLTEYERAYDVLNKGLEGRDYLVGEGRGRYSAVDMFNFASTISALASGVDIRSGRYENVKNWFDRIWARPAVKQALKTPIEAPGYADYLLRELLEKDEEARKLEDMLQADKKMAKEKYNYLIGRSLPGVIYEGKWDGRLV